MIVGESSETQPALVSHGSTRDAGLLLWGSSLLGVGLLQLIDEEPSQLDGRADDVLTADAGAAGREVEQDAVAERLVPIVLDEAKGWL